MYFPQVPFDMTAQQQSFSGYPAEGAQVSAHDESSDNAIATAVDATNELSGHGIYHTEMDTNVMWPGLVGGGAEVSCGLLHAKETSGRLTELLAVETMGEATGQKDYCHDFLTKVSNLLPSTPQFRHMVIAVIKDPEQQELFAAMEHYVHQYKHLYAQTSPTYRSSA